MFIFSCKSSIVLYRVVFDNIKQMTLNAVYLCQLTHCKLESLCNILFNEYFCFHGAETLCQGPWS